MVDLSAIIDIEKIRESKDQMQNKRVNNARLSGWEEMSRYIQGMEESLIETKKEMENENENVTEYMNGQIETLQMLQSFIAGRVQLMDPTHPLAQTNELVVATM